MHPWVLFPKLITERLLGQGLFLAEPKRGDFLTPIQAMRLAIQQGYRGLGFVSPNPLVGCVILDSHGRFLSSGFHAKCGEAHAEVNAMKGLSQEELRGAQVYVTLEPCAHQGRTPSCAQMLKQFPIAKVICGLVDPNPLVAGKGIEILKNAGILAEVFDQTAEERAVQSQISEMCEHFLWNMTERRPFVSLKVASSLDGQLGLQNGESKWITDEISREVAHLLRAAHDSILVGAGTVRQDNPSLNVRHPVIQKALKVFILNHSGDLYSRFRELNISRSHHPEDVFFIVDEGVKINPMAGGPQLLKFPLLRPASRPLEALIKNIGDLGVKSIFVEGGGQVLSSFLTQRAAQRLYLFQAPMILGAGYGQSWSKQVIVRSITEGLRLQDSQVCVLAKDFLITGRI